MRAGIESILGIGHPREVVFDFATDHDNLPKVFRGFGPIPPVLSVEVEEGGDRRWVTNGDGSVVEQQLIALERPERQVYRIVGGFKPPFSWMVRSGGGTWTFHEAAGGTRVEWSIYFDLRSRLAAPLVRTILSRFWRMAMFDCLNEIRRQLDELRGGSTLSESAGAAEA